MQICRGFHFTSYYTSFQTNRVHSKWVRLYVTKTSLHVTLYTNTLTHLIKQSQVFKFIMHCAQKTVEYNGELSSPVWQAAPDMNARVTANDKANNIKDRQRMSAYCLLTVAINDISVIHVTAHICAGRHKKKLDMRSGSRGRHKHFVGLFIVPVKRRHGLTCLRSFRETAHFR